MFALAGGRAAIMSRPILSKKVKFIGED